MAKPTYWKEIARSFTQSKGRFLSIFSLMGIGALALIALKVTTPDMQQAAQDYLSQQHTFDLAVMADYGLSADDVAELESISGATVEFGYLTDMTMADSREAVRIFSAPQTISQPELVAGKLAAAADEIALSADLVDRYQIGDTISFDLADGATQLLTNTSFTVTGFIQSAEFWKVDNLGSSTVGTGQLTAYALVAEAAFDSQVYSIARIVYADLAGLADHSQTYQDRLADHQRQLDDLLADNGQNRLTALKSEAQTSIDEGYAKIAAAEKELADGQKELEKMEAAVKANPALAQGLDSDKLKSDFETQKAEAEEEIATRKADLETAEADLAALTEPAYTSYTRETLPSNNGYLVYKSGTEAISAVGNIFPVVLYGVAALVTLTTMTRFVDEERQKSGIYCALGYSKGQVMTKFLLYGLVAAGLGSLVGGLLGNFFVSPMISKILATGTVLGQISPTFHLDWFALALGASFLSAVVPAYLVANRELTEETACLLQAKPPVAGSQILLERVTPLWNRLSFTHKVTARNIFRYKQRMAMTIFGVAGSVALLFAGLGIQSSISGVATTQFDELIGYDLVLVDNSRATQAEQEELAKLLSADTVAQSQTLRFEAVSQTLSEDQKDQTISLLVADSSALADFIQLRERETGDQLTLDDSGAIISEKLGKLYGVGAGETIRLTVDGQVRELTVAGISEMYAGHFVYLTPAYYEAVTGETAQTNATLVTLGENQDTEAVASRFLALPAVAAVVQNTALEASLTTIAGSLQSIMLILITLSVLLGIVILYNLTNINVAERLRELSTIKVLGFHNREVTLYIYRETMLLSLVGILVGLLSGFYLHRLLIDMIASPFIMFKPSVDWTVYLAPILSITAILTVLGIFVNHKLRRVDMLEALKSLE